MEIAIIIVFILGYAAIALEHPLKIDKTASALLLGMLLWTMYAVGVLNGNVFPDTNIHDLVSEHGSIRHHLGEIAEILFFLMGAMTIVELIDVHGGFSVITDKIKTRKKVKLLWILALLTFFMSAVLDNLTTSIVMVMLLRKIIAEQKDRWIYASMIIIAANSGGAWSPIGDVTTIMLWVKGNVTTVPIMTSLFIPSFLSMAVPVLLASFYLKGELSPVAKDTNCKKASCITFRERNTIFLLGIFALLLVPVFKTLTHLPPFIGVLFTLSILWIFLELMYNRKKLEKEQEHRVPSILQRIDLATILFFLGILLAVGVLQEVGILKNVATYLTENVGNVYVINLVLGALSSIVDNVPLVAAAMGMYPIADAEATGFLQYCVQDGTFWQFLAYCAGVGGSMLIIGSAAGVVVMGLEKINFGWYLKKITLLAMAGYLAGAGWFVVQKTMFGESEQTETTECVTSSPEQDETTACCATIDGKWVLTKIGYQEIAVEEEAEQAYVMFNMQDSTVAAYDGCNNFGGFIVKAEGGNLEMKDLSSTMAACPDQGETAKLGIILNFADKYEVKDCPEAGKFLIVTSSKDSVSATFKFVEEVK
ncbi:MAG: sodium:proton antiporter NhaD [Bacteroidales bacterium]|nr:sodium:proton antiporter NhaD [Bacteroidales bacterium]